MVRLALNRCDMATASERQQRRLTLREAAALALYSPEWFAELCRRGEGPTFHKRGRIYTFERADVDAWIAAREDRTA